MKKYLLLFILLFMLASCSIRSSTDFVNVTLGTPFELKLGQTAEIEGHRFMFKEVSSDSRCPVDAECIWSGEATVVLVSVDNKGNEGYLYLSTNSTGAYQYLFPQTYIEDTCNGDTCTSVEPPYGLAYLVSLISLSPEQKVGKEIQAQDYVATMIILPSV
jgi:hypothetical protein